MAYSAADQAYYEIVAREEQERQSVQCVVAAAPRRTRARDVPESTPRDKTTTLTRSHLRTSFTTATSLTSPSLPSALACTPSCTTRSRRGSRNASTRSQKSTWRRACARRAASRSRRQRRRRATARRRSARSRPRARPLACNRASARGGRIGGNRHKARIVVTLIYIAGRGARALYISYRRTATARRAHSSSARTSCRASATARDGRAPPRQPPLHPSRARGAASAPRRRGNCLCSTGGAPRARRRSRRLPRGSRRARKVACSRCRGFRAEGACVKSVCGCARARARARCRRTYHWGRR